METNHPAIKGKRGTGGFGSIDVCWAQLLSTDKPYLTLLIQGRAFLGLVDTGADVSVIASQHWPKNWPLLDSDTPIRGVGQACAPKLSADFLNWFTTEGHQGVFQPFVLQIDLNLWGRDVLTYMGVSLTTAPIPRAKQPSVTMALKKWDIYKAKAWEKHYMENPIPSKYNHNIPKLVWVFLRATEIPSCAARVEI